MADDRESYVIRFISTGSRGAPKLFGIIFEDGLIPQ